MTNLVDLPPDILAKMPMPTYNAISIAQWHDGRKLKAHFVDMPNGLQGEWVDHPIGDGRHFKTVKEARAYAESLGYRYLPFEAICTQVDYIKWREHNRNLKREMKKYGY